MKLHDAKSVLLGNSKVKKVFEKRDLEDLKINIGLQILELRLIKNLTQEQLARKIGTQQPSIARVERGATLPSLSFLHKIAKALKTELIYPKFALVEENERAHLFDNPTVNQFERFEVQTNPLLLADMVPMEIKSELVNITQLAKIDA